MRTQRRTRVIAAATLSMTVTLGLAAPASAAVVEPQHPTVTVENSNTAAESGLNEGAAHEARATMLADADLTQTPEGRIETRAEGQVGVSPLNAGGMTVTNARARAQSYLQFMSFSRHGLIAQIEFEQFPTNIAVQAVDSLNVNWNEQAVRTARSYLQTFPNWNSRQLMDQLTSQAEGFRTPQAIHATRTVLGQNAPVHPAPPAGTQWAFGGNTRAFTSVGSIGTGTTSVFGSFAFPAGNAGEVLAMGDWDGDGVDTPMIRRGNQFIYTNDVRGVGPTRSFNFGRAGDDVFVGDWNGDGRETIGLRRGNVFFLNNVLAAGNAATQFNFGRVGDEIQIGDWNSNGQNTVGLRRGVTFFLSNSFRGGNAEIQFDFGRLGDGVLIGDWNGDGRDSIGLRRFRTFFMSNQFAGGNAEIQFTGGTHGDEVIVGNFTGRGGDQLLFRR